MPTVAGIKIKTKQPKIRNPIMVDEKYTGPEPIWPDDAITWSDFDFDHLLRKSFNYYNYYYTQKDLKKYVVQWMQHNPEFFTSVQVRAFVKASDRSIPMQVCGLIMAHNRGMPLKDNHLKYIRNCIAEAIQDVEPDPVEVISKTVTAAKPSIQDRMAERTLELMAELEGEFDAVCLNQATSFKHYNWFTENNVVQSQLVRYEELFASREQELVEAQQKKDPQLREAYAHYKATDFKRVLAWIEQLYAAIEQYRGVKKATKKARVKKAPSKEKLVAKLKYARDHKELKIVSLNPVEIIGASALWVYNAKTRKLGKYVADSLQTLGVKGSAIVGYDEAKSVSKTIRKPEETLKEFARAGKVALRKFLTDIRATETKLNGRINDDVLLLKVE